MKIKAKIRNTGDKMNNDARAFFAKHNIDIDKLANKKESHIWNTKEIDKIIADYCVDEEVKEELISIADIVGYDPSGPNETNIFYSFDDFFNRNGDGYHSRSCGLLDIPEENIMQALASSFKSELMVIHALYDDYNLIYTNGLHRYTVLRAHFLNESSKFEKGSEEYEKVKQKYTIPVKVKRVDLLKTYSKYLLSNYPALKLSIRTEYDEQFNSTGNMIIIFPDGEKRALNDEQLIAFTREMVLSINNSHFTELITWSQQSYEKFGEYIDTYIPELSIKLNVNDEGGLKI